MVYCSPLSQRDALVIAGPGHKLLETVLSKWVTVHFVLYSSCSHLWIVSEDIKDDRLTLSVTDLMLLL